MNVEELLLRLDKVKKTGTSKWHARCPAHQDKSPSLSIKDADGKILLHCFAGCSVDDICGSIGIELTDLFPDRVDTDWQADERPVIVKDMRFSAIDALRCLESEGFLVLLMACDVAEGKCLGPQELDRATTAVGRIKAALDYLGDNK